jgi:FG-GAP repeat
MNFARRLAATLALSSALQASPQVVQLLPSDPSEGLRFGGSTALDRSYAYVSAAGDRENTGALYVFDRSSGQQILKLTPPDGKMSGFFGYPVLPRPEGLLVGYIYEDTNGPFTGSVFLYSMPSGQLLHKFYGSTEKWGAFGTSLAADEDLILIGAHQDSENGYAKGAAFLFDAHTFEPLGKLVASDGEIADRFGKSVAISSDRIVVGAPERGGQKYQGRVYVFDRATLQELYSLDLGEAKDTWFGAAVAVSGDNLLLVGAPNSETDGRGAVYVYDISTGALINILVPSPSGVPQSDGALSSSDFFGASIHTEGDLALIQAPFQTGVGPRSGVSFLFHVPSGRQILRYAPPTVGEYASSTAPWLLGGDAIVGAPYYRGVGAAWIVELGESVGQAYCGPAASNSTGASATLRAWGIDRVMGLPLTLIAERLPAGTVGYPLISRGQDFIPAPPGSLGNLCLGGVVVRLPNRVTRADGSGTIRVPLLAGDPLPAPLPPRPGPGETWNFQVWFRDLPASNFTDGLEILFR